MRNIERTGDRMRWSKDELRLLRKYYRNYSTEWLAIFFGRTDGAVRKMASRQALRKKEYFGYRPHFGVSWGRYEYKENVADKWELNWPYRKIGKITKFVRRRSIV